MTTTLITALMLLGAYFAGVDPLGFAAGCLFCAVLVGRYMRATLDTPADDEDD